MDGKYHEVFIPFDDVLEKGGSLFLQELSHKKYTNEGEAEKKNLVILPISFVEKMERERIDQPAYDDILRSIDAIIGHQEQPREKVNIYEVNTGLDLAILDHWKPRNNQESLEDKKFYEIPQKEFKIYRLERFILDIFGKQMEQDHPTILTGNSFYRIKHRGSRIENPSFLMIDASIVDKGLIKGTDELLQLLIKTKKNNDSFSLEKAKEFFDHHLYLNQIIYFTPQDKPHKLYAKVTGDLSWDDQRQKLKKVKNKRLELILPTFDLKNLYRPLHTNKLRVGDHIMPSFLGITPRDDEQYLAMQCGIANPDVSMLFIPGGQGSGKTILAMTLIDQVLWYNSEYRNKRLCLPPNTKTEKGGVYNKLIFFKPTDIIGGKHRDLGFLPGDLFEKLAFHLDSYRDAFKQTSLDEKIEFEDLFKHPKRKNQFFEKRDVSEKIFEHCNLNPHSELVELVYSAYVRGRTFENTIIVIDEAQNYTPYEIKTVVERAGKNCKIVIIGDPMQKDNPNLSMEYNGFTFAISHFLPKDYSMLIKLGTNYRHSMSEDAKEMIAFSS